MPIDDPRAMVSPIAPACASAVLANNVLKRRASADDVIE
jgi:hypothetical protein